MADNTTKPRMSREQYRQEKRRRKVEARNKYLDYMGYLCVRACVGVLVLIPRWLAYGLCKVLGWLMYHLMKRFGRTARDQLRQSFPDWSNREVRRVAKASIQNMVCMGLEVFLTPRLITALRWRRYVTNRNMEETIRLLIERKSPLILVTGHFGNWEVAGYYTAMTGLPTNTVARRLDNPYLNDLIFSVREQAGQRMIYKVGAAEGVQEALGRNEAVSMVCDQDAGGRGMFVDFFGRPASTFKSIGLMAMQFDSPIAVVCCKRLGCRFRFEVFTQRVIHPAEWAGQDDPLRWITQEYTSALEQAVRENPEQYFWVHRRWKHQPKVRKAAD